ncbi:MAG: DNA-3-methyladenine glycosylase [Planctomycetota bacterium]|nr:DNA-3-methyladenine glycosylase [Planctomycetota bacterium]
MRKSQLDELKSRNPALPARFYDRATVDVALDLLGKQLLHWTPQGVTVGMIVEVEAYLPQRDPACHTYRGRTPRNEVMFGPAGLAYVYSIHARYCLNAVTESTGQGCAVLIRAVEPVAGIELMQMRRGQVKERDLTRGPARLCEAFGLDRRFNGLDLTGSADLWLAQGKKGPKSLRIMRSARIGVTEPRHRCLRFFLADNEYVSGPRKMLGMGPVRRN